VNLCALCAFVVKNQPQRRKERKGKHSVGMNRLVEKMAFSIVGIP
jgi:hypothetical protein